MSILDKDEKINSDVYNQAILKVARIFHPVGQGGFYSELFSYNDKSMVVFDCGGSSTNLIEQYIESFLLQSQIQIIEAIFISHLHDDHINGLQYLLKNSIINRIFLPQFTKDNLFEALFYNAINTTTQNNTNTFIVSLVNREISSQVTEILEEDESIQENSYQLGDDIDDRIPSGAKIWKDNKWVYIPYNPTYQAIDFSKAGKSYQNILEHIYNEPSIEERAKAIADFVQNYGVKTCKNIYKKIFGGIHNNQSMTVFSGLLKVPQLNICMRSNICSVSNHSFFCWQDKCCEYNNIIIPSNFLYTGDFDAANTGDKLQTFYKNLQVWDTICGVQIPHHGSCYNFNRVLYDGRCFAVASAGTKNKYGHPHLDSLIKISRQWCMPYIVTEDKNSIIFQQFKCS